MTPEQAQQFMDLLMETIRTERPEFLNAALEPILARLEGMARGMQVLAQMLQQNRRDFNATEAMKIMLAEADKFEVDITSEEIAKRAYAIAVEMEKTGNAEADAAAKAASESAKAPVPSKGDKPGNPGEEAAKIFRRPAKAERKARAGNSKPGSRSN